MGTWPSSSLCYCSPSLSVAQSLHLSSETNLVDLEDDLVDLEDDLVDLEETNLVDLEDDLGVVLSVSEMERPNLRSRKRRFCRKITMQFDLIPDTSPASLYYYKVQFCRMYTIRNNPSLLKIK